jgi:uncharacterized protein (DUF1015 family)
MAHIKPFKALRPQAQYAKVVASKPYDVLSSQEAKVEAEGNAASFLHITKSEIDLNEDINIHDEIVYQKAKENLAAFIQRDILFTETKDCFYIYQLIMQGRRQTGLVCVSSIDDYENNIIKKHEFTRPEKEKDRINHITTTGAQTGNVFLAYRNIKAIDIKIEKWKKEKSPIYDFIADDGVQHSIWVVNDDEVISETIMLFDKNVPHTYIADGHHRAASAAKVRQALRNKDERLSNTNFFLTTLFPANQLHIMDYNRVVMDLNGLEPEALVKKISEFFTVKKSAKAVKPKALHSFGMYLNKQWYTLQAKEGTYKEDPISILDVSILQENILHPLLGIADQRTDKRIDFVGGIRGIEELEKIVNSGKAAIAFSLYPVSMEQLFNIADSGKVMPPKSTWFEPKLRDGLLTHLIYE